MKGVIILSPRDGFGVRSKRLGVNDAIVGVECEARTRPLSMLECLGCSRAHLCPFVGTKA